MYTKETTILQNYHLASNAMAKCDISMIGTSATVLGIVEDEVQVVKHITNPL